MTQRMTITTTIMSALLVLAIATISGIYDTSDASAQTDEGLPRTREIRVTGQGNVRVDPDVATVRLGVETEASTASEALAQNNDLSQLVQDILAERGIANEDIATMQFSISPIREREEPPGRPEPGNGEITGYSVTHMLSVTIRDLDQVGTVLDQAVQAGANRVYDISFTRADLEPILQQARMEAMQNARVKAEQFANAADATVGEILTITEQTSPRPPTSVVEEDEAAAPVPVQPGEERITVDVQVTYVLR